MWNDTEIPLAYLITFRTYGTWLHGDERGSIDRDNNIYETPYKKPNDTFYNVNQAELKSSPVLLDAALRGVVRAALLEVCEHRKWSLQALNVRTNHIHMVVSIGVYSPSMALNSLKAYAARKMRDSGCWEYEHTPWAARGSKRKLWNERSVEMAIDYVLNGQGGKLLDFDQ
jgi:REP element-mobilizing transposase RayT